MNVKTQDMEMAVEACWYNNQLYVPFLDLARAFRKQAMVTSGGLGVPPTSRSRSTRNGTTRGGAYCQSFSSSSG